MINQKALKKQLDEIGDSVLKSMVLATLKAGNKITKKEYNDELMEKGEHHFIVTSADFISQKIILKKLSADFPSAYFITEEKEKDKKLRNKTLNSENFKEYVYKKENYIFGIDSLDGTSQYKNGLYEWSVSIGEMFERNERGSIYAPEIKGGLLAFGGAGNGVYLAEGKNKIQKAYVAKDKEDKNSVRFAIKSNDSGILIGNDGNNIKALNHMIKQIAWKNNSLGENINFFVDVNDYQYKNIKRIRDKALEMAEKAIIFKRDIELEPMSSFERMLVHSALADKPNIETESSGDGIFRKVSIKFKN